MNERAIDSLARSASASQGRRLALKALGAATLAGFAGMPLAAEAKNNKNNNNKNKNKKRRNRGSAEQECPPEDCTQEADQAVATRCQSQVFPCELTIKASCGNDAACLARLLPCCQSLGACDATEFFSCLTAPQN